MEKSLTNESNRFYVKQISRHDGSFPAYHTQVDIALPSYFLFVYAHHERYFPSPMGLPIYLGFSAFSRMVLHWTPLHIIVLVTFRPI